MHASRLLRWLVGAAIALSLCATASDDTRVFFIGPAPAGYTAPAFRTATAPYYFGLSSVSGGPYDAERVARLVAGRSYNFSNESPDAVFITTTVGLTATSGGAGDLGSAYARAVGTGGVGTTLVVTPDASAPQRLFYQSQTQANAGFLITVDLCGESVSPTVPELLEPAAGSTVSMPVTVTWRHESFGANCDALATADDATGWYFRVLVRTLAPSEIATGASLVLSELADTPGQSDSGLASASARATELTSGSLEANNTYALAVLASNGARNVTSATRVFTVASVAGRSAASPIALDNARVRLDVMSPSVPVAASGALYYDLKLDSPGGTVEVSASPLVGSAQLFALAFNESVPAAEASPSATSHVAASESSTGGRRAVLRIESASASGYRIALHAPSGSGLFALSTVYSCARGTVLTSPTGTACEPCPTGSSAEATAGASSLSACVCLPGFFGPAGGPCSSCPDGAICAGGERPIARRGFWSDPTDEGAVMLACAVADACLGGSVSDALCASGYEGRLCADCASEFYHLSGRCARCPPAAGLNFFVGIGLLVVFALCAPALAQFYTRVGAGTVALTFVQLVAILPLYSLRWPQYLLLLFADCSGFNLNPELSAAECLFSMRWRSRWLFYLALPLALAIAFAVLGALAFALRSVLCCGRRDVTARSVAASVVSALVAACMFLYLSVAHAVLSFFDCTRQSDGSATLDASSELVCYSSEWFRLLPLAVAGLFVYVLGIPLAADAWLKLNERALHAITPRGDLLASLFGPVYMRYKVEVYWWEALVFARKIGLLIIGVFLSRYPRVQAAMAIGLLVIALVAHAAVLPFESKWANRLETLLLAALIGVFLTGTLFYSADTLQVPSLSRVLFSVIVVLFAIAFAGSLVALACELWASERPVSPSDMHQLAGWLGRAEQQHLTNQRLISRASRRK